MIRRAAVQIVYLATAYLAAGACLPVTADDVPAERRHDAGPLTADDFQAPAPDPLPNIGRLKQFAHADTDIRFTLDYRYETTRDGVEAKLTKLDVYAVFLSDKSWLSREEKKLIDHEQGHFDITQIHALQAKLHARQQLAEGKTLVGRGEDLQAALVDLQHMIREFLKPTADRTASAHVEYDRGTRHGIHASNQAAHRQRQLELLVELTADLEEKATAE